MRLSRGEQKAFPWILVWTHKKAFTRRLLHLQSFLLFTAKRADSFKQANHIPLSRVGVGYDVITLFCHSLKKSEQLIFPGPFEPVFLNLEKDFGYDSISKAQTS